MEFCAKFSNFSIFKKILESIKELSEQVYIECHNESLEIEVFNLPLGTYINIRLLSSFFQEYTLFPTRKQEKNVSFTVNSQVFYDLLKMAQVGDIIELTSVDVDKLDLVISSPGGTKRTFKMNLYSKPRDNFPFAMIDDLKFKSNFNIRGDELIRIGNNMQIFSNVFDLCVDTNYVEFKIINDLTSGCISIPIDERHSMDLRQSCSSKYSCKLFNIFNKTIYECNKINLKILENNELLLKTDNDNNVFIRYCLVSYVDYIN